VTEAEQYAKDLEGSHEGAHVNQVIALWPKRPPSSAARLPEVRNVVAMLERQS
jgi:hypothetical protein